MASVTTRAPTCSSSYLWLWSILSRTIIDCVLTVLMPYVIQVPGYFSRQCVLINLLTY